MFEPDPLAVEDALEQVVVLERYNISRKRDVLENQKMKQGGQGDQKQNDRVGTFQFAEQKRVSFL
jgi:hypothetical protein